MLVFAVVNPILVLATTAIGVVICRAAGVDPHVHEMAIAMAIALVAAEAALVPLRLQRGADRAGQAQATLVGTVLHLLLTLAGGAGVMVVLRPPVGFAYWMLALYWVTLIGLSGVFIRTLRSAGPPVVSGR